MIETKAARAARLRCGKRIKLFDFREAHIDLRAAGLFPLGKKLGDAVERLRPEDHVHPGRAVKNLLSFLARHAPAHGNHHAGTALLRLANAPEVGKDLFLRFFAD